MVSNPFFSRRLMETSFFNKHAKENYLIELENLLHSTYPQIPKDISSLAQYKVSVVTVKSDLSQLLRRYTTAMNWNDAYAFCDDDEIAYSKSLKEMFSLTEDEYAFCLRQGLLDKARKVIADAVEKKNVSIKYKDLLKYDVGKDFVGFEKSNGKSIFVKFTESTI